MADIKANRMFNNNKFKLGFFAANCSGGMAVTQLAERWDNSWENNLKMAQLADEAGLEFLLPIARWIGYGGATNFHGNVLETTTWAAALLAATRYISVFSTVHTSFNHPVVVAKQLATMDQIGQGRAGLNVVCGWNRPEYEALGGDLPYDHVSRYAYGQEWFDVIQKLWQEEKPFDWEGHYFKLKETYSLPHPLRKSVPIFNAAGSSEGREFAVRNADFLFTSAISLARSEQEIAGIKKQAANVIRRHPLDILTFSYVVCCPTRSEAEEYQHYYSQQHADWAAVDNIIRLMFENAESFPKDQLQLIRDRFSAGHGGFPLVGTPDDVADGIARLHQAGFSGSTLSFVNYAQDFPYFRDEVLPRLEARGLREPFRPDAAQRPGEAA
ncbi:LLM class flavin-dependent oxidoreductase [Shimwellia pseudoproteus]|uniref:LLM class flavin-dependent oxidoreductase n=1 Tax=Shimwellia pseudoproteus TaxID=570012 RepID=UPI0018EC5DB5|nr:LLM class flavin-dependent oxidoreductase [Shimwellia pseudoproteus]MBJ3814586.1 LLM class flavin-dependent oxidoreductase [Shimwellia pseudoproteus]